MAVLNVRVPEADLEALQLKAQARGTTVSDLVRALLAAPEVKDAHVHTWSAQDTRINECGEREYLLACPCGHQTWG